MQEGREVTSPTLQQIIVAKFELQRRFGLQIERHLAAELETLGELRDEVLQGIGDGTAESTAALNEIFSDCVAFEFLFPHLLRSSLFLSNYSLFEDSLNRLCHIIEVSSRSRLRLKDLRGSGVIRARLFLDRIAELTFDEEGELWADVNRLRLLRNCLAHQSGELGEVGGDLDLLVEKHPALTMDEAGHIVLEAEFGPWAYSRLESFLLKVARYADSARNKESSA